MSELYDIKCLTRKEALEKVKQLEEFSVFNSTEFEGPCKYIEIFGDHKYNKDSYVVTSYDTEITVKEKKNFYTVTYVSPCFNGTCKMEVNISKKLGYRHYKDDVHEEFVIFIK